MKQVTDMNVIIKGIEVAEDAALAVEYGADGIIVSIMAVAPWRLVAAPSNVCRKLLQQ